MLTHCHRWVLALACAAGPAAAQIVRAPSLEPQLTWLDAFDARNYACYSDKVNVTTRPAYDSLLEKLEGEAKTATSDAACDIVLRQWVAFFRDRHLGVGRQSSSVAIQAGTPPAESPEAIRARYASWERRSLDQAMARAR